MGCEEQVFSNVNGRPSVQCPESGVIMQEEKDYSLKDRG
jgi:hypothetical protein